MPVRPNRRTMSVAVLISSIFAAAVALAAPTTAEMKNFNSTVDKNKNMHLEVTAEISAPEDKVFDAISHPELTSKSDPRIEKANVVSQDSKSKIVELFGQQVPMPNAPPSLKIKVIPDKASNTIKVESYQSPVLQFQNEYKLSPAEGGKGTIVKYTSVSNDISKQLGIDTTDDMRKQFGIQTFMDQMHTVGLYIDDNSKKVATSQK